VEIVSEIVDELRTIQKSENRTGTEKSVNYIITNILSAPQAFLTKIGKA
jgi:hypothetical protein